MKILPSYHLSEVKEGPEGAGQNYDQVDSLSLAGFSVKANRSYFSVKNYFS